jgi:hypothetical protein
MKMHGSAYQHLSASTHLYTSALVRISHLFDAGKFSEGKWEWLKLFPGRFELSERNKVDLWGNEEEMFVSKLYPVLETTFTSTCGSAACPARILEVHSKAIRLR